MTRALPGARLPAAFAASLALHAGLVAALVAAAAGSGPSAGLPAFKPEGLFATLRAVQPAQPSISPAPSPRQRAGSQDGIAPGAALPRPYYHPASELTERPLPLAAIEPSFPYGAPPTGRLKIRVYINEQGSVDTVEITDAEPAGEFEEATLQAFKEARFRPGYKDGTAVRSLLALEVRFGEPFPMPVQREVIAAVPENPNAFDAPGRLGIKTRRAR
jgi:TonB family protein